MAEHQLWSFSNALIFLIILILIVAGLVFGVTTIFDVKKVKANWAENRCSPTIMPFAALFGYNTKENFEFCMGKVFQNHSQSYFGSIGTMFSHFTSLLTMIFGAVSSLRNIIASLGGGINVVFQEFTERISTFFFRLRLSAIRIKQLIGRMYAILFSVMYMGLSGITGMTSFTNTQLFQFLDVGCFPKETELVVLNKGKVPIKDIKINDILLPSNSRVTGLFKLYVKGQSMVQLGSTIVSTNHYVNYNGKFIQAVEHPNAIKITDWNSDEPLYCLDTHNHIIPVNGLTFLDYDETSEADKETMEHIQAQINSSIVKDKKYKFTEYCPAISENTILRLQNGSKRAKDLCAGDKLATGSEVAGLIRRKVTEICKLEDGTEITPSTLLWKDNKWIRVGEFRRIENSERELISFIVVPNSQLELENGNRIRDYMELCSPDSEMYYSKRLEIA